MSESALHDRLRPERQADSHSRRYRESGFGSRFNAGSDQGPGKGFYDGHGSASPFSKGKGSRSVAHDPAARGIVLLLLAAVAAALVAVVALLLPPALRITHYDIIGAQTMGRDEVLSAALIHDKEYFFSIDPARLRNNLLADPKIADAEVRRLFPGGLRIVVRERKAVATTLVETDGTERIVLIDDSGMAFAAADPAELRAGLDRLPIISGIRFEGFRPGTQLPDDLRPVFTSLGEIERSDIALLAAFSEIRIVKSRFGEMELVLYPVQYRIPVRAAAVLNASTLRSIILVLDVLGSRGLGSSVAEIDFRTGTVVYRSKEGQSG
ncbi:MAG: cell division protein FtsQ/DivIB [Rectinemataceae bacterium]